jgi:dienelactone hydrolase
VQALAQEDAAPAMQVLATSAGTPFGLFGKKPAEPAPTLFVFALGLEQMGTALVYTEVGRHLARDGFLYVAVEPPCHGADARPGEPVALQGWRHRIEHGDALMPAFIERTRDVLDHLVREGYTDPQRVAACGTSRGGFCALHFAAAERRVHAVAAFSPVTDLALLSEFQGIESHPTLQSLAAVNLADQLADRPVWISIGNNDLRVGTDAAIAVARRLAAAAIARDPQNPKLIAPVELIVGPSAGHSSIDRAHELAAQWLLRQFK